jgi:hypothetical protein
MSTQLPKENFNMKGIPALVDTHALVKERIFATGKEIAVSAERLKHLQDNFYPQKQKGVLGYFHRRGALEAFKNLTTLFKIAESFHRDFYIAESRNDAFSIQKPCLLYTVEMGLAKEDFIKAFSYDFNTCTYDRKKGEENWKWVLNGLIVPELRSLGK